MSNNPFEGLPIIHAYTSEMAINDGVLIDVSTFAILVCDLPGPTKFMVVNLATPAALEAAEAFLIDRGVDRDSPEFFAGRTALLRSCARKAVMTPDNKDGYMLTSVLAPDGEKVWFVMNDTGRYTVMLPSDY